MPFEVDLNNVIPALRAGGDNYIEFYEPGGVLRKTISEISIDVITAERSLDFLALPPRARIGITGATNYQWLVTDLACLAKGNITIPFDPDVTWDRHRITEQLQLDALFTDRPEYIQGNHRAHTFASICGDDIQQTETSVPAFWDADEPFTATFTSGTTGSPKGILVKKRCFDDQFVNAVQMFSVDENDKMLVFLPFHIYLERCFVYLAILRGFNVVCAPPRFIPKVLRTAGFTFSVGVPQFFSSLRDLFLAQARENGRLRLLFELRMLAHRFGLGGLLRRPFPPFQRMLGGRARFFLTGSASCPLDVLAFFRDAGIPLYEGYGMSEIAGLIALNYPGNVRLGTVGKLFPNKELKFTADNQILVRGPNVANSQYWLADEQENASTFLPDGWVATGDVGHIDRDGYLTLDGRVKDVIVLSTGQKVQPAPIEAQLNQIVGVDNSVVLGTARPYLVALIAAKRDQLDEHAIEERIRRINETRPDSERVKRFRILNDTFSAENGLLNASLKLDRKRVVSTYTNLIQQLYET
ncbi:AMP-binding protein [Bradyrhizobium prioriisuperbiae]|uniref:AMP-binding protein n=1 Tax=Bradyrhizobium prioriisuperbiae TaxID=2854389 RepID=UPI0028E3DF65|nr:AMP-binding protein [Bradyrhizobium prioritasuperba]